MKIAIRLLIMWGTLICIGCGPMQLQEDSSSVPVPGVVQPNPPRRVIEPHTLRFRLAVVSFVDQTAQVGGVVRTGIPDNTLLRTGAYIVKGDDSTQFSSLKIEGPAIVQSLPDVLFTELVKTKRFDMYDLGQLRNYPLDEKISDKLKVKGVDAVLTGAITSVGQQDLVLDTRLINLNQDDPFVMWADSSTLRFRRTGKEFILDRTDMKELARRLSKALPSPSSMRRGVITSRDGDLVSIDLGQRDHVTRGMSAFVVNYAEELTGTPKGAMVGSETFFGEITVFAVYPRMARAYIYRGSKEVQVGDYVLFK